MEVMTQATLNAGSAPARPKLRLRPQYVLPVLSLVVVLSLWEAVGQAMNPLLFAPPSRVVAAFAGLIESGELLSAMLTTLSTLLVGFALAIVVGIPLGVLLAQVPTFGALLSPYLYGIFSTPRVVIVPLVIIWFGVGYSGRLFLIFLWSMIAISTSTADGIRNARPDLIEVAKSYGASRLELVRHVLLPGSVPFIVSGLRIGAERAVVGVVIGEMFLQLTGLGGLLVNSAKDFATAEMLCAVVVIAVIGTLLIMGLDVVERRVSSWKTRGK
jgi:ABC-type nitrate/sulfonate/bicarbonate transport system permease component